jgi:hypothetical protein
MIGIEMVVAAALAGPSTGTVGPQLVQTPTEQEVTRCIAEESRRDQLAVRRQGVRTRSDDELRSFCQADVAARFDARILGRPMPRSEPIPYAGPYGRDAPGGRLAIDGPWWMVGPEVQAQNRFMYFVSGSDIRREGDVATGWLTVYFERSLPNGATNKASRIRVNCRTGQWASEREALRDDSLRLVGEEPATGAWRPAVTNPNAPIVKLAGSICRGESAGARLADERGPPQVARDWFTQNPR